MAEGVVERGGGYQHSPWVRTKELSPGVRYRTNDREREARHNEDENRVSLHTSAKHRFDAHKRLKSSL